MRLAALVSMVALVVGQAGPALAGSVRRLRPLAVSGELGWNSLAGAGLNLTYHFTPYGAVDAGFGLGASGWRTGLRGRVNFFDSDLTPFAAAGVFYSMGSRDPVRPPEAVNAFAFTVAPSPFALLVVGAAYATPTGVSLMVTAGYAKLLRSDNVRIVEGNPDREQRRALRLWLGSGVSASISAGYAF